ncbi:serine/threonine protein kinase (plasmid) [Enterobacter sp. RHB15-C17]|nr:serine/threonine protein kinase [Enterobacter sp. RHB15-C17]
MGDITNNFSRFEFQCHCGCGFNTIDTDLVIELQTIREFFGKPIHISSGCRCTSHNAAVGGAENSQHLQGIAADFVIEDTPPADVVVYLQKRYPHSCGIGLYASFTHFDIRVECARWYG